MERRADLETLGRARVRARGPRGARRRAAWPATTICPPPFRFAGATTSLLRRRLVAEALDGRRDRRPITAAIAPTPGGTAACMRRPRSRTPRPRRAKRARPPRPAPTTRRGCDRPRRRREPAFVREHPRDRDGGREQCRLRVLGERERSRPVRPSTAWTARRRGSHRPPRRCVRRSRTRGARSAPMPTRCEPCPGNRHASRRLTATSPLAASNSDRPPQRCSDSAAPVPSEPHSFGLTSAAQSSSVPRARPSFRLARRRCSRVNAERGREPQCDRDPRVEAAFGAFAKVRAAPSRWPAPRVRSYRRSARPT